MKKYNDYMAMRQPSGKVQNHLIFGEDSEEESSSDDDLKRPSVMEKYRGGNNINEFDSGIKKGIDPEVGEY